VHCVHLCIACVHGGPTGLGPKTHWRGARRVGGRGARRVRGAQDVSEGGDTRGGGRRCVVRGRHLSVGAASHVDGDRGQDTLGWVGGGRRAWEGRERRWGRSAHGVAWVRAGGVRRESTRDGVRARAWGARRPQKACGAGGRSAWRAARGVGGTYNGRGTRQGGLTFWRDFPLALKVRSKK
jgi:hypothetical protein